MPKKKTITDLSTRAVSTDISKLDDKHIEYIREKFNFLESYNIQVELDYAATNYHLFSKMPKKPTPIQSNERLGFIQNKISELTCALNNLSQSERHAIMDVSENRPQKFFANETIDYLNELSLQIAVAQSRQGDVVSKAGRKKKTHQSVFLDTLYSVYEDGTGKKVKCWYNDCENQYKGDFVAFCEYVIKIYRLPAFNSSIGDFVKNKRKTTAKDN